MRDQEIKRVLAWRRSDQESDYLSIFSIRWKRMESQYFFSLLSSWCCVCLDSDRVCKVLVCLHGASDPRASRLERAKLILVSVVQTGIQSPLHSYSRSAFHYHEVLCFAVPGPGTRNCISLCYLGYQFLIQNRWKLFEISSNVLLVT